VKRKENESVAKVGSGKVGRVSEKSKELMGKG
jgi:hypothetical protein